MSIKKLISIIPCLAVVGQIWAQHPKDSIPTIALKEITVNAQQNWLSEITQAVFVGRPVLSSQDLLQTIPGLWIGQHAGGGKAEQLFLRGFDLDHGTDISIAVDGVPVNMVSHAHGQGYADLHFVIPETIEKIEFEKGPYGTLPMNFATAGAVAFQTKKQVDNLIKAEIGSFNTHRLLGLWNLNSATAARWIGVEYIERDGPFESPQGFYRTNITGSWSQQLDETNSVCLTANHFESSWDASGQIPQRAVDQKIISRFGAIDDKEGGSTSRTQLNMQWKYQLDPNTLWTSQAYGVKNKFDLYSNFTFFLEDPIYGDQISQKENRNLWGMNHQWLRKYTSGAWSVTRSHGIQWRFDRVSDLFLGHTAQRYRVLDTYQSGTVDERQWGSYHQWSWASQHWNLSAALRWDRFRHTYRDENETYLLSSAALGMISPKFQLTYQANNGLAAFVKAGRGFHSNDTRAITSGRVSPSLPGAVGIDVGFYGVMNNGIHWHLAAWKLDMEQEFVYVGDAGIVEPKGASTRKGMDLTLQQEVSPSFQWNAAINSTRPRFKEGPSGANYIPLAPTFSASLQSTWKHKSGIYAQSEWRKIADRPANEDYSITARGYSLINATLGLKNRNKNMGIQLFNLLNSEWNETQFATESRLYGEESSVEEIHFTPGSPLDVRVFWSISFN